MHHAVGELALRLDSPAGPLDGLWLGAPAPRIALVLAHGAGAGFQHANMMNIAAAFASVGISTLRFNFPFMQAGKRRVDAQAVAVAAIQSAAQRISEFSSAPLWLGGHSFGGRMASHAAADAVWRDSVDCRGLIYCGFPLHAPKKPGVERAAHLAGIGLPMLFLSGTRDDLANAALLQQTVDGLSCPARIAWLETANHSYTVLKRTRTNPLSVFEEMAQAADGFLTEQGFIAPEGLQ